MLLQITKQPNLTDLSNNKKPNLLVLNKKRLTYMLLQIRKQPNLSYFPSNETA
jgi:hypothetical protein